jgi:Tol biopolymer transport system component
MDEKAKQGILEELGRILETESFRKSPRLSQFLSHIVHVSVQGAGETLKESTIGVEVFDRESGYDPKAEPVVRVQARRLREKLAQYYETAGDGVAWRIELPKGGYVPEFAATILSAPPVPPLATPLRMKWIAVLGALAAVGALVAYGAWRRAPEEWRAVRVAPMAGMQLQPAVSPSGGELAMVWRRPGTPEGIYVIAVGETGAEPRKVGAGAAKEWRPAWRRDGGALAFLRQGEGAELKVVVWEKASGIEREIGRIQSYLIVDEGVPGLDWTADSSALITSEQIAADRPAHLIRMDVASGATKPVTNPPSASSGDVDVKVSPDGRRIAFQRGQFGELWVAELGAGGAERERKLLGDVQGIQGFCWKNEAEILYARRTKGRLGSLGRVSVNDGAVANWGPKDAHIVELTRSDGNGRVWGVELQDDTNIWWLPRGGGEGARTLVASTKNEWGASVGSKTGKLAYLREGPAGHELWVAEADGGKARFLARLENGFLSHPEWDAEEARVAFHGRVGGNSDLYLADARTGSVERLTTENSRELMPVFSRDGRTLLLSSDRGGSFEGWRMDLKTKAMERLGVGAAMRCLEGLGEGEYWCVRMGDGLELVWTRAGAHKSLAKRMPRGALAAWDVEGDWAYYSSGDGIWKVGRDGVPAEKVASAALSGGGIESSLRLAQDKRGFVVTNRDLHTREVVEIKP